MKNHNFCSFFTECQPIGCLNVRFMTNNLFYQNIKFYLVKLHHHSLKRVLLRVLGSSGFAIRFQASSRHRTRTQCVSPRTSSRGAIFPALPGSNFCTSHCAGGVPMMVQGIAWRYGPLTPCQLVPVQGSAFLFIWGRDFLLARKYREQGVG